jgi:hypothetical protein
LTSYEHEFRNGDYRCACRVVKHLTLPSVTTSAVRGPKRRRIAAEPVV